MQNDNKPLAIIGAERCEVEELIGALENASSKVIGGKTFHSGSIEGMPCVIVECGVGKVNAACATQMAIDLYQPRAIVNTGVAGGVAGGLHIGDFIIGEKLVQHDFDISPLGYVRGELPNGPKTGKPTFVQTDISLLNAILDAVKKCAPEHSARLGCIASGDIFVASSQIKNDLRTLFNADAAEMEGAAVAYVAQQSGIPCAVVRAISDLADGTAPDNFAKFDAEMAHLASLAIRFYCKANA